MTRAAIYCRVSSAGQAERGTIESQRRVLREYVARQGWELTGAYEDDGRSAAAGKLGARDAFARLVVAAGRREFTVLAVVDVDRLSRTDDLIERAQILGPLQRAGVSIATPSGGLLDLRTMLGELSVTLQALGAAAWLEKHRERVRQGRITAAQRGRLPAGRPPWGLAYDRGTGAWSVDPVREPVVVELFERVARGETCNALADELNVRGMQREGGRWHRSGVATIIRARYPVGEWTADAGRGLVLVVPRLVSDELWARANAELGRTGHRLRGLRKTRGEYLLEGLAVCAACGAPIGIRSRSPTSAPAYICSARRAARRGTAGRCLAPILVAAEADARVWTAIRQELEDPALEAAIAGEVAGRAEDRRDWAADAAGYQRKLDRLAAAETALLARFTRGAIGEVAMDAELERIARERAALHRQLEACARAGAAAAGSGERLREAAAILAVLRDRLPGAPFAVRRAIVERLVRPGGVVLGGDRPRVTLLIPRPPVVALVSGSACRAGHESEQGTSLRIRMVA